MRLNSITSCHDSGDVYGIQFHMAKEGTEVLDLDPIGVMELPESKADEWTDFKCDVLVLPE